LRQALAGALYSGARAESGKLRVVGDGAELARLSFSGRGEDWVAISAIDETGVPVGQITYLDIGAAHPMRLSNTYAAYRCGARGVLVEPDPEQARLLRRHRPGDVVINAAIAFDQRRSAELIHMSDRVFNTFNEAIAQQIVAGSKTWATIPVTILDRVKIDLIPIDEIIDRHLAGRAPHFLSVDTEGCDLAILKSLDLTRFKPTVICTERSGSREEFEAALPGYAVICRNTENLLFRRLD
jgi:FkbM family methyltransferase